MFRTWRISGTQVRAWWRAGELGANSKVSRKKALQLFSSSGAQAAAR